jgi:hypothetical protein
MTYLCKSAERLPEVHGTLQVEPHQLGLVALLQQLVLLLRGQQPLLQCTRLPRENGVGGMYACLLCGVTSNDLLFLLPAFALRLLRNHQTTVSLELSRMTDTNNAVQVAHCWCTQI